MTVGWCSRTVRAAVFAAVCVLLAALGHVLMSGHHVPWWALATGAAVTGAAGWGLAGRERGLPLIVTVVVTAQTALHSAFSVAQSATAGQDAVHTHTGAMGHDMSAMPMGAAHMSSMPMGSTHTHSMDAMDLGPTGGMSSVMDGSSSFGMLAAHLLAALLCGLWLAHGERAAFRILRAVAGWLAAPLRLPLTVPAPPHRPRPRPRRRESARSPRRLLLVHAITSRGPPLGSAV
ncbi:hypothetical protein SSP24_06520 [Streptomyces spinoverrucosus]|uniref:Integral membrane protein n=1 Tax=Streptomyces spinoverrucosus TaxID=284043 RepID=A0A4Y3V7R1_9ACTN|nr:hypothetical protein [Streptomyces spinoverrucosus]GEC02997.1 hypothetical protein SSP24_06520 [Streptomyces spinoverrucosus]GHB38974.1 hypothetical protein GCM10010397_06060 [Streptomyces spinoverrucosus]